MLKEVINELNSKQKEAVENINGPLLILAGAGTGKTKTLMTRIASMIEFHGIQPWQVFCVTFTNKASLEMKERLEKLISFKAENVNLGTFHSLCFKILVANYQTVGLKSGFMIVSVDNQKSIVKEILPKFNIDIKEFPAKQVIEIISSCKDKGLLPKDITKEINDIYCDGNFKEIYKMYQQRLLSINGVDFGDLILYVINLFKDNKNILEKYQNRFKYILVDEYQDTNVAQYDFLKLLANKNKNICCVGDDDQSIYGWRGADVNNILNFEKDYPNSKLIKLEENYRSTSNILETANHLIANNERRLGKKLFTKSKKGEKVKIYNLIDAKGEADKVVSIIRNIQQKKEVLSSIAVLVRAGFQTRAFEEKFLESKLPYKIIGSIRFYERAEIQDMIAYLRLIEYEFDDLSFQRIINKPARGIGKVLLDAIKELSGKMNIPYYLSSKKLLEGDDLSNRNKNSLLKIISMFEKWKVEKENLSTDKLLDMVLEDSGYLDFWKKSKKIEAKEKIKNINELVDATKDFKDAKSFLEHISLVLEHTNLNSVENINIVTLHGSKGLEFDNVFLCGWEEGVFPSQRAIDEGGNEALEEERRLAYVGITRARKKCYITYVNNRQIHGNWTNNIPSRFIDELPIENIEITKQNSNYFDSFSSNASYFNNLDFTENNENDWRVGEKCFHIKFGTGYVKEISGDHLTISFLKSGIKKVISHFVEKHS